jgi:hypothetical protein
MLLEPERRQTLVAEGLPSVHFDCIAFTSLPLEFHGRLQKLRRRRPRRGVRYSLETVMMLGLSFLRASKIGKASPASQVLRVSIAIVEHDPEADGSTSRHRPLLDAVPEGDI